MDIKKYLKDLKNKFDENDNYYQVYKIVNGKVSLIGNAGTAKEMNTIITDNLPELNKEGADYVVKITYDVQLKKYDLGPITMNASISQIINGKVSKKGLKNATIYYTVDELENQKLMKNDFKLLISALLNEEIESNPLKIYTRKSI